MYVYNLASDRSIQLERENKLKSKEKKTPERPQKKEKKRKENGERKIELECVRIFLAEARRVHLLACSRSASEMAGSMPKQWWCVLSKIYAFEQSTHLSFYFLFLFRRFSLKFKFKVFNSNSRRKKNERKIEMRWVKSH